MAVFEGTFTQDTPLRLAIIIGRFNDLVTSKLLEGCQDCLKRHGIDVNPHGTQVDYVWVPGSFEVPLVARQMALTQRYDAVICLGAVIRGQTPHFDYVAAEVAKGIAAVGFHTGVPVIFGILTVDTMQQALERAGIKSNNGWEYAMNALEMASLMRKINSTMPAPTYPAYETSAGVAPSLPVSAQRAIAAPPSLGYPLQEGEDQQQL
ncbi:MAG: 6,7-dimethyl-8-ribityllumazine synthase [Aphanothece sp. CMT-3BRIN-NPC111]|jgi:6,7-dimethyl-8-ribityllumazine synthase|nr:6,7-dimethyl-8-ribityllumazine synthase [Aphanothece sp. CMT-3BRIN-NPC111]